MALVQKPEGDQKLYRFCTLRNGVRVLLISDPTIGADPGGLAYPRVYPGCGNQVLCIPSDFEEFLLVVSSIPGSSTALKRNGKHPVGEDDIEDQDSISHSSKDSHAAPSRSSRSGGRYGCNFFHNMKRAVRLPSRTSLTSETLSRQYRNVRKAAAAVTFNVGSSQDPPDLQGLAHLLEHAVILGSEDFPGESEFLKFLYRHGGEFNACTTRLSSTFQIAVKASSLYPVLKRFAAALTKPTFPDDAMHREVRAVHSESIQRLDADANRFEAVIMSTTTGGHPLRNFTSGNQESLRIQKGSTTLQSRASKHWQAFYTPSQMTVVVWGRENLEVLNSWACELFDDKSASAAASTHSMTSSATIPRHLPQSSCSGQDMPFKGSIACMLPGDGHMLTIMFQLPSPITERLYKVNEYWSKLLTHEGPGSLLSSLKKRNWALRIQGGTGGGAIVHADEVKFLPSLPFEIGIELTSKGLHAASGLGLAVVQHVFDYIAMLQAYGPQEWLWHENRVINHSRFRCETEVADREGHAARLSQNMHIYRPEHVLSGPYLHLEWQPGLTQQIGEALRSSMNGLRVGLQTSEFRALTNHFRETFEDVWSTSDSSSRPQGIGPAEWMGVGYLAGTIPLRLLNAWEAGHVSSPGMHLPPPNPFISEEMIEDAVLYTDDNSIDATSHAESISMKFETILDEPRMKVLYNWNATFCSQLSSVVFTLNSSFVFEGMSERNIGSLLEQCIVDHLQETISQATEAGFNVQISFGNDAEGKACLMVTVTGYTQKLGLVVEKLCQGIVAFEVDGVWDRVKEDALEQVEQYYRDLDSQVDAVRTCLLSVSAVLPATDVDDMAGQTMSHVKWLYSDLRERCTVYVYVTGAIPQDGAESMGRCIQTQFLGNDYPRYFLTPIWDRWATCRERYGCTQLQRSRFPVLACRAANPNTKDSAVQLYFQLGMWEEQAMQLLCAQVVKEHVFTSLRTRKGLGYTVTTSCTNDSGSLGLLIYVRSQQKPHIVANAIRKCLDNFAQELHRMPPEHLDDYKNSVAAQLLEAPYTLESFAEDDGEDNYEVFLDLQEIEKQDLVEFYDSKILSSGSDTRALVVACTSNRHSRVFEAGVQGRWVLLDPIAARNKLPVAPWSVSNAIHNMAVGMAVPGSRLMCCSCTCCDD